MNEALMDHKSLVIIQKNSDKSLQNLTSPTKTCNSVQISVVGTAISMLLSSS